MPHTAIPSPAETVRSWCRHASVTFVVVTTASGSVFVIHEQSGVPTDVEQLRGDSVYAAIGAWHQRWLSLENSPTPTAGERMNLVVLHDGEIHRIVTSPVTEIVTI